MIAANPMAVNFGSVEKENGENGFAYNERVSQFSEGKIDKNLWTVFVAQLGSTKQNEIVSPTFFNCSSKIKTKLSISRIQPTVVHKQRQPQKDAIAHKMALPAIFHVKPVPTFPIK